MSPVIDWKKLFPIWRRRSLSDGTYPSANVDGCWQEWVPVCLYWQSSSSPRSVLGFGSTMVYPSRRTYCIFCVQNNDKSIVFPKKKLNLFNIQTKNDERRTEIMINNIKYKHYTKGRSKEIPILELQYQIVSNSNWVDMSGCDTTCWITC